MQLARCLPYFQSHFFSPIKSSHSCQFGPKNSWSPQRFKILQKGLIFKKLLFWIFMPKIKSYFHGNISIFIFKIRIILFLKYLRNETFWDFFLNTLYPSRIRFMLTFRFVGGKKVLLFCAKLLRITPFCYSWTDFREEFE